jgi:hypothetical protein
MRTCDFCEQKSSLRRKNAHPNGVRQATRVYTIVKLNLKILQEQETAGIPEACQKISKSGTQFDFVVEGKFSA